MNILTVPPSFIETLQSLLVSVSGQWTGCNWQTAMGTRRLNLKGMRSSQARILASATSGDESTAWDEATIFLVNVENDAKNAERAAHRAVELMDSGRQSEAMIEANKAVSLEAKYRDPVTWRTLRDAVAEQ